MKTMLLEAGQHLEFGKDLVGGGMDLSLDLVADGWDVGGSDDPFFYFNSYIWTSKRIMCYIKRHLIHV